MVKQWLLDVHNITCVDDATYQTTFTHDMDLSGVKKASGKVKATIYKDGEFAQTVKGDIVEIMQKYRNDHNSY